MLVEQDLDQTAKGSIEAGLAPGEKVTWMGAPDAGRAERKATPMTFIGIVVVCLMIWITMRSGPHFLNGPGPFVVIPLLFVASIFLLGPWLAKRSARRTVYGLTDRRAIIAESRGNGATNLRSLEPSQLKFAELTEQADGSGTVILASEIIPGQRGAAVRKIGFFNIPDARSVYASVRALAEKAPVAAGVDPGPTAQATRQRAAYIVGAVFTIVGLSFVSFSVVSLTRGLASRAWPTAPGTVVESSYAYSGGRHPSYTVSIHYNYEVGGAVHAGNRVQFGLMNGSFGHAVDLNRRYQKGKAVAVRYDPSDPSECVLEPGVDPIGWILPGMGGGFSALGIASLVCATRLGRKKPVRPD